MLLLKKREYSHFLRPIKEKGAYIMFYCSLFPISAFVAQKMRVEFAEVGNDFDHLTEMDT